MLPYLQTIAKKNKGVGYMIITLPLEMRQWALNKKNLNKFRRYIIEFMKRQIEAMTKFMKVNGKVLMLAYPRERYIQSGAKSFTEFGKMTDGERTPWAEWYDDEKVEALFGPNFKLNWSRNFGEDNK